MRTLFIWVYLLIVGGFVGAFYLMEYLGHDLYIEEFSGGYQEYVARITPFIAADIVDAENPQETLAHWQHIIGEELISLKVIGKSKDHRFSDKKVAVTYLELTDLADKIRLVSQLPAPLESNKLLEFYFVDAFSDDYESWYQRGVVGVYLFMALLIGLLLLVLFRYLEAITSLTSSVIAGDLSARLPPNSIDVFNTLSENLNQMVQELETKHKESEIFLGAIHHELRSPITKLRLALDMALDSNDMNLLQELLRDMDVDLEELNKLMEDILMLSRLRLQKQQPEITDVDLNAVIEDIVLQLADTKINYVPRENLWIKGNKVLFALCLINIIGNALKFAKSRVTIEIYQAENLVKIAVSDDGPGIPEAAKQQIFQPFYRVDKGRSRSSGGVGLGLAIAKLAINSVSGEIQLDVSSSGGTRFIVELPGK